MHEKLNKKYRGRNKIVSPFKSENINNHNKINIKALHITHEKYYNKYILKKINIYWIKIW